MRSFKLILFTMGFRAEVDVLGSTNVWCIHFDIQICCDNIMIENTNGGQLCDKIVSRMLLFAGVLHSVAETTMELKPIFKMPYLYRFANASQSI